MEEKYKNIYPLFGSYALRELKMHIGKIIKSHLPFSLHVFNHIRWEINTFLVRLNNAFNPLYIFKKWKIKKGKDLSVNVGCGPFGKKGWINLDLMNYKNVYLRYDCRRGLPLKEKSAVRIRCEQFLEHLDSHEDVSRFLRSCFKCLIEGGVLRVATPDAEKFLLAYNSGKREDWLNLGLDLSNLPEGFYTKMDIINEIFREDYEHAYLYDFETLEYVLKKAGFKKIIKSEFGASIDSKLCDDLPNHKPYSLYVDAIK